MVTNYVIPPLNVDGDKIGIGWGRKTVGGDSRLLVGSLSSEEMKYEGCGKQEQKKVSP